MELWPPLGLCDVVQLIDKSFGSGFPYDSGIDSEGRGWLCSGAAHVHINEGITVFIPQFRILEEVNMLTLRG